MARVQLVVQTDAANNVMKEVDLVVPPFDTDVATDVATGILKGTMLSACIWYANLAVESSLIH